MKSIFCHLVLVLISLGFITSAFVIILNDSLLSPELKPYGIALCVTGGFLSGPACDHICSRPTKTTTRADDVKHGTEDKEIRKVTVTLN